MTATAPEVRSGIFPMDLEFRTIERYPGYRFCADGSIWSCWRMGPNSIQTDKWRRLSPQLRKDGYRMTLIRREMCYAHRLILEAFVGPCPEGMECCHGDGNRSNNAIGNLRWGTGSSNTQDRWGHGTLVRGPEHFRAKLTEPDFFEIRRLRQAGCSLKQLADKFNTNQTTISKIVNGKQWAHLLEDAR